MAVKQHTFYNAMPDHYFMWGYREPFQRLVKFVNEIASKREWTLMVSGEPGSGKTWMLRLFLFTGCASENWWRVLAGNNMGIAEQLIHSILTRYPGWKTLEGISVEMNNVLRYYGTESIRKLFSQNKSSREIEILVADDDIDETVWNLFTNTVDPQQETIHLWVEDLHSSDHQDLEFLEFLQARCQQSGLSLKLVVSVARKGMSTIVREFLEKNKPEFNLQLKPWTEDDIVDLMQYDYGISMLKSNREFVAEFYKQVGGLPFQVTQTIALLQEAKVLVPKKGYGWGVRNWNQFQWPASLEELLTKRLKRVSEHTIAWQVLKAVSVLTGMNDIKVLEQSLDLTYEDIEKQLSLLYYNGFLDREYRFRQPVMREVFRGMLQENEKTHIAD